MSNNRLHDSAIEVLRQHAKAIKATDHTLTVRTPAREGSDLVVQEIVSALRALSGEISVTVEHNEAGCFTAKANSATPADNSLPVKRLATMIADAGVNFPGSADFRTPRKNPG